MIAPRRMVSSSELLGEAARWRLHALLLSRPTAERRAEARTLLAEVNAPELSAAARAWCEHASEGSYLHLLGPGGLVPAREVAYRAFADPGWLLADIARFHAAFGFHSRTEEPSDHVAVLLELVAYLLLKEAYARECDDDAAANITRDAREHFIFEHVVPVVTPLAERLQTCGASEWAVAPRLLAAQLPPPAAIDVSVANEDAFACGACAATPAVSKM